MIKVLMVIYGALIVGLGIMVYMNTRAINKLTTQLAGGTQNANPGTTDNKKTAGDNSALFGDMVAAVKDKIKTLEVKATTTA